MSLSFKPFNASSGPGDQAPVLFQNGTKVNRNPMPSERAWRIAARNMGLTGHEADEAIARGKQRLRRGCN